MGGERLWLTLGTRIIPAGGSVCEGGLAVQEDRMWCSNEYSHEDPSADMIRTPGV